MTSALTDSIMCITDVVLELPSGFEINVADIPPGQLISVSTSPGDTTRSTFTIYNLAANLAGLSFIYIYMCVCL